VTPRTTIAAAAAFLLGHGVVLAIWGHEPPGPVISSVLQMSMGILCVAATVSAARAAGGTFERRFLLLVAARYVIFTVGQAIATYHERDVTWEFEGSLPDILFHLEDVPLGIAFFLDPGRDSDRLARPHPLDLAQIVLFWAAMFLYVRYLSSDAPLGVGLGAGTAALVAGCYYIRSLTSRSSVASAMFGRWTAAIMLSSVNDAYSGYYNSIAGAGFDLVWSFEMLVWIVTTATWRAMPLELGTGARRIADRTVYLLPVVVTCFSLVLSLGLAQRQPGLAALLVVAAVGCSAVRFLKRRRLAQTTSRTARS
jgi:hypothetical protein